MLASGIGKLGIWLSRFISAPARHPELLMLASGIGKLGIWLSRFISAPARHPD